MTITNNEIKDFIKKNIKGIGNKDLTNMVNKRFNTNFTINQIKSYKARNHLNSGLKGYFNKGHKPFNKGKKWDEYMPKETQKKCRQTCFTKDKNINQQRHNWKENGTERTTKDGYIEIRVGLNKWELKHRFLFKQYNNVKLSDKDIVIFANRNLNDFRKENLKLITRQELLTLNQNNLIKTNIETTVSGINLSKYIIKINKLKKGEL